MKTKSQLLAQNKAGMTFAAIPLVFVLLLNVALTFNIAVCPFWAGSTAEPPCPQHPASGKCPLAICQAAAPFLGAGPAADVTPQVIVVHITVAHAGPAIPACGSRFAKIAEPPPTAPLRV